MLYVEPGAVVIIYIFIILQYYILHMQQRSPRATVILFFGRRRRHYFFPGAHAAASVSVSPGSVTRSEYAFLAIKSAVHHSHTKHIKYDGPVFSITVVDNMIL